MGANIAFFARSTHTQDIFLAMKINRHGVLANIGGYVDPTDTSFESAVEREILEETKIQISSTSLNSPTIKFRTDWTSRRNPTPIPLAISYHTTFIGYLDKNGNLDDPNRNIHIHNRKMTGFDDAKKGILLIPFNKIEHRGNRYVVHSHSREYQIRADLMPSLTAEYHKFIPNDAYTK